MIVHSGRQNIAEDVAAAIKRHQDGDANAMEDLFRVVRPWLHGIGRACRLSIHSADDVVQNTMAVALAHLPRLRDPNAGLAWLSVIARREAIKISREERRTDPIGDRDAWTGGGEDPEEIALARMACKELYRALSQLPERERKLLVFLFFDEGYDYAAIARELNMPIGSIGPTRQRGLKKVRTIVNRDRESVYAHSA
jgi:RNA polymerase sigma factor (sigma-70 family)